MNVGYQGLFSVTFMKNDHRSPDWPNSDQLERARAGRTGRGERERERERTWDPPPAHTHTHTHTHAPSPKRILHTQGLRVTAVAASQRTMAGHGKWLMMERLLFTTGTIIHQMKSSISAGQPGTDGAAISADWCSRTHAHIRASRWGSHVQRRADSAESL